MKTIKQRRDCQAEDVVESSRTRHWDKDFHQLREEFNRGTMIAQYIDTKLNAADILTKSVDVATHERHTATMSGLDWEADRDQSYQQTLPPEPDRTLKAPGTRISEPFWKLMPLD